MTNCSFGIFQLKEMDFSVEWKLYGLQGDCKVGPRFPVMALFTNHRVPPTSIIWFFFLFTCPVVQSCPRYLFPFSKWVIWSSLSVPLLIHLLLLTQTTICLRVFLESVPVLDMKTIWLLICADKHCAAPRTWCVNFIGKKIIIILVFKVPPRLPEDCFNALSVA